MYVSNLNKGHKMDYSSYLATQGGLESLNTAAAGVEALNQASTFLGIGVPGVVVVLAFAGIFAYNKYFAY